MREKRKPNGIVIHIDVDIETTFHIKP
jgi:hypothetical protein